MIMKHGGVLNVKMLKIEATQLPSFLMMIDSICSSTQLIL